MEKRIGVFGGSFNPIHIGHLILAESAWQEFDLEKIIFVPTGDTPNKNMYYVNKVDRYQMVKLAIEGNPHFSISPIEIERGGPSYTVDTIHQIKIALGHGYEIFFLAGTDAVADLPTWKYNKELVASCHIICAGRPGSTDTLYKSVAYFGELGRQKIHFLKMPELEISSTDLRWRIQHGLSVTYMIPEKVITYMKEKEIYRGQEWNSIE